MTKYEIFRMWERQLVRLERMSEKAEYAKALSGLTDTMMELSDRLLHEEEQAYFLRTNARSVEMVTGSLLQKFNQILKAMMEELGDDHSLTEQMGRLRNQAELALALTRELSGRLKYPPNEEPDTEEEDVV